MKHSVMYSVLAILALVACKKEETKQAAVVKYSFTNQPLQGKIANEAWSFKSGAVEENPMNGATSDLLLYDVVLSDACDPFARPPKDFIYFSDPNLKVGLFELGEQDISLYDRESNMEFTALKGAYEIMSIDTVQGIIKGRIDARVDADNFVNGNFTLNICK